MSGEALFVRDGDGYLADAVAEGPWAPGALHGGAPAALLAHLVADHARGTGLALARLTCEFVRPVPRGPLRPEVAVVRPGRRVTLLDVTLHDPQGTEVTRARALLLAPSELAATPRHAPPFPGPEAGAVNDWHSERSMYVTHAMEIRFVTGRFREVGPATAWFRLRPSVVAGEPTLPRDRIAAAADFGNGIASELSWGDHVFINPDLTVYMERDPVDEWIALQSQMRVLAGSVALAESVLWDREGRIGHATQSLLVSRTQPVPTSGETP